MYVTESYEQSHMISFFWRPFVVWMERFKTSSDKNEFSPVVKQTKSLSMETANEMDNQSRIGWLIMTLKHFSIFYKLVFLRLHLLLKVCLTTIRLSLNCFVKLDLICQLEKHLYSDQFPHFICSEYSAAFKTRLSIKLDSISWLKNLKKRCRSSACKKSFFIIAFQKY